MTTQTKRLYRKDIDAGLDNPEWQGFGYLGERCRAGYRRAAAADAALLRAANRQGWTVAILFDFVNSRDGRYFGDEAFGGWDRDLDSVAQDYVRRWQQYAINA